MNRPLPSLNALRAFEAAARLQSMSRAAHELHVTHGAISRQIRALEAELGTALFKRQGRGIGLTHAGLRLRDTAATAFEQLREVCAGLRNEQAQAPLVLGCPGSVLARWVIPRMEQLAHELPELKLHLVAHEGAFDPALPGLDAALMLATKPHTSEWRLYPLAQERVGPVLSPRHADYARLCKASPTALGKQALLHTTSRPQAWPDWAVAVGLDPRKLRYGQSFEHLYYLLEAAVAGLGVAIAPEPLVAADLAADRLTAPWGFQATSAQWLLAAPHRSTDPRIPALAAWLHEQLRQP